jgi:hypothetical protein
MLTPNISHQDFASIIDPEYTGSWKFGYESKASINPSLVVLIALHEVFPQVWQPEFKLVDYGGWRNPLCNPAGLRHYDPNEKEEDQVEDSEMEDGKVFS